MSLMQGLRRARTGSSGQRSARAGLQGLQAEGDAPGGGQASARSTLPSAWRQARKGLEKLELALTRGGGLSLLALVDTTQRKLRTVKNRYLTPTTGTRACSTS